MIEHIRRYVVPAAWSVLPKDMASERAERLLLAIGWQESRFVYRQQVNGPARGFWQFEQIGVAGVLGHSQTQAHARKAMLLLAYPHPPTPYGVQVAIEHNDVLATVLARLLLWTVPGPLPDKDEPDAGWAAYVMGWRPGRPRPETWAESWAIAWNS